MKTLATTVVLFLTFGSLLALFADETELFFGDVLESQIRIKRAAAAASPANTCNGTALECCAAHYGPKCMGCNTLLTCADGVINKQSCSSINAAKTYCTDSACTAAPPDQVCLATSNFRCTSQGFFPNPDNCSKYYYCVSAAANGSYIFDCPSNYAYQSTLETCKLRTSTADCKTVSCVGNSNKYQVWTADKSILAYCADTPEFKETLLFRCKDPQNMEYDAETLKCKFVCKAEGHFAYVDDCTQYYECYKNGTALQNKLSQCPPSFQFDPIKQMCYFAPGPCP